MDNSTIVSLSCSSLCSAWNEATNPAKLRTEEEHIEKRAEAKILLAELRRRFREGIDFIESESSGRFYARRDTK